MAPRKNIDKSQEKKTKEKKVPKQKLKKEKPKLKIPTLIRIKIPKATSASINENGDTQNLQTKKDTLSKKELASLGKLERANEVARLQLVTTTTPIEEPNVSTEKEKVVAPIRKRKLPKNKPPEVTDTTTASGVTDSEVTCLQLVTTTPIEEPNVSIEKEKVVTPIRKRKLPKNKPPEVTDTATASGVTDSEVACLQLVTTTPIEEPNVSNEKEKVVAPIRKRKLPKNKPPEVTDTTTASGVTDSEDAFDTTPMKRKYVRKAPGAKVLTKKKPVLIRKCKAAEKKGEPKKTKKPPKVIEPKSEVVVPKSEVVVSKSEVPKTPKAEKVQATSPRKTRLTLRKNKPGAGNVSSSDTLPSPSLLDRVENNTAQNVSFDNLEVTCDSPNRDNTKASPVDSRKTSMTSGSEPSWTRDISSSSTTTCVTVCSTDFFRIDNKLPVLKVTNIDHYKLDKLPKELDLSSDSDSSSSLDSSPKMPEPERRFSPNLAHGQHVFSSDLTPKTPEHEFTRLSPCLTPKTPEPEPRFSPDMSPKTPDSESRFSPRTPDVDSCSDDNSEVHNDKPCSDLDRLTANLKKFDMEIMNWIGYNNTNINVDVEKIQNKVFTVFKEESEVIAHCQRIKHLFSDLDDESANIESVNDKTTEKENHDTNILNDPPAEKGNNKNVNDFVVPVVNYETKTGNDGHCNLSNVNNNYQNQSSTKFSNDSADSDHNFASDKYKYISFDKNYDDDDTLSLFAESLTGMESCRMNNSIASLGNAPADNHEEYIPQPLSKELCRKPVKITYVPTKILGSCQDNKKIVCEKQRADSTSITKDQGRNNATDSFETVQVASTSGAKNSPSLHNELVTEKKKLPCLMSSLYKSLHGVKSTIFKGICFYNLLSSCKKPRCRFPHVILQRTDVTIRLVSLSEEDFIQEYMLLRNWPVLRRAYGMCFVEECKRRELTRILVEMAIDFYMKANTLFIEDVHLKVIVAECVLLYLNNVDLNTCEDLLLFNVQQDVLLCDVFMKTIADSQNFSRFKPVFIKLTKFIVEHGKTFNLEVAIHILERVVILPCEPPLTVALFEIVRNTDRQIFDMAAMGRFENQLANLDEDLYEQFLALKKESSINRPVLSNLFERSLRLNTDMEPMNSSLGNPEREARYTSPDTTNLDSMSKATDDSTSTRPEFTRHNPFNIQLCINNSPAANKNGETRQVFSKPQPNFQGWKGQTVFDNIRGLAGQSPSYIRPPVIKRRIHQQPTHGRSPAKKSRWSGTDVS